MSQIKDSIPLHAFTTKYNKFGNPVVKMEYLYKTDTKSYNLRVIFKYQYDKNDKLLKILEFHITSNNKIDLYREFTYHYDKSEKLKLKKTYWYPNKSSESKSLVYKDYFFYNNKGILIEMQTKSCSNDFQITSHWRYYTYDTSYKNIVKEEWKTIVNNKKEEWVLLEYEYNNCDKLTRSKKSEKFIQGQYKLCNDLVYTYSNVPINNEPTL